MKNRHESSGGNYENQNEISTAGQWKIAMKGLGVSMKVGMKYQQLNNENLQWKDWEEVWKLEWNINSWRMKICNQSSEGKYENQNEVSTAEEWKIIMKAVQVGMKIGMKYQQLDNEKLQWKHCTFQSPPNSCRTPQDSAGLQAKVLILVASPAKLGRVGQSLEEFGRTWAEFGRI